MIHTLMRMYVYGLLLFLLSSSIMAPFESFEIMRTQQKKSQNHNILSNLSRFQRDFNLQIFGIPKFSKTVVIFFIRILRTQWDQTTPVCLVFSQECKHIVYKWIHRDMNAFFRFGFKLMYWQCEWIKYEQISKSTVPSPCSPPPATWPQDLAHFISTF